MAAGDASFAIGQVFTVGLGRGFCFSALWLRLRFGSPCGGRRRDAGPSSPHVFIWVFDVLKTFPAKIILRSLQNGLVEKAKIWIAAHDGAKGGHRTSPPVFPLYRVPVRSFFLHGRQENPDAARS